MIHIHKGQLCMINIQGILICMIHNQGSEVDLTDRQIDRRAPKPSFPFQKTR